MRRVSTAQRHAWVSAARVPLTRPVRLVVASGAGGVGRTTVALALAERLAALRAERVAVLDAQARGGTVGLRVSGTPGRGLAALLEPGELDLTAAARSATAWSQWAHIEHTSRVSVFGRTPFDGPEMRIDTYAGVAAGMAEVWPIVVVDTGGAEEQGGLQDAVVQSASAIVVVAAPGPATDAATAGWLTRQRAWPPRVGVVVPLRTGDITQTAELLSQHCTEVIHLPTDRALTADTPLPLLARARQATQDAISQLTAAVMPAAVQEQEQR